MRFTLNKVIVAVGSNIEPEKNIEFARQVLRNDKLYISQSPFIKTKPIGPVEQEDFINGAFYIQTVMDKEELKKYLVAIENNSGRERGGDKWGPRTLDLDIVWINGEILDDDYYTRSFVRDSVDYLLGSISA